MKLFLKYTLAICLSIILFFLLYLLAAFSLPRIAVNENRKPANDVMIYLLSNGVHTDIVVPVKTQLIDWSQVVKYEHTTGNDTSAFWVGFGWGDKGFYLQTPTWDDLTFGVAFRAATGLSTSAIHSTFHKHLSENEKCVSVKISNSEYKKLTEFILAGFERTPTGNVIQIVTDANYGTNDAFYEANGRYHLFHTCNTWTNNGLKTAGLKTGWWTPFDWGILYHYPGKE